MKLRDVGWFNSRHQPKIQGEIFYITPDNKSCYFLGPRNGSWGYHADQFVGNCSNHNAAKALLNFPAFKLLQHNVCSGWITNMEFELCPTEKW